MIRLKAPASLSGVEPLDHARAKQSEEEEVKEAPILDTLEALLESVMFLATYIVKESSNIGKRLRAFVGFAGGLSAGVTNIN